ncbi:MAG: phosphoenolpyruvate--protein phosphotransferase [Alphaproteobacteria bacterium]|nr:phosphoenolpyruvate--protein phosphotransferase [Alphaproteobacteria bacterium]
MKTNSTGGLTREASPERVLHGIKVSPGIAIGTAFVIDQHGVQVPEYAVPAGLIGDERKRFQSAVAKTQKQLGRLKQKAQSLPSGAKEEFALLLDAYTGMLSGSRLVRGVEKQIERDRINAEAAIQRQIAAIAASFAAMDDPYLASRVEDVREVGARLLRNLLEQHYNPFANAPEGSILIAEDFTPADTALMNPDRIAGFAAVFGGAEGHAAIMARALGLPAVLGVAELLHGINTGDAIIVDGGKGVIVIRPSAATLQHYRQESARLAREARKLKLLRGVPSVTSDGIAVKLHANLEFPREMEGALDAGAEGVGLLRTEFMFMNRPDLPGEDEQFEMLRQMLQQMEGKPLTVRTLDVGGEKLASALNSVVGESTNPALGLRAVRLGLREPKLMDTQLAAILRAAAYGPVRVLVPMVSTVTQMRQVRERLMAADRRLRRRRIKMPSALPPLGAMIEIPGAALAADAFTKVCDFFAIGSNDLTQYTLAIDRADERVADLFNPFHPAVLRLIQFTIAAAWRANIPVCLCGEMAGDPRATAMLLGLGLREFSMAPARLPFVKQVIRALSMPQAVAFAESIMATPDENVILALLERQQGGASDSTAARTKRH